MNLNQIPRRQQKDESSLLSSSSTPSSITTTATTTTMTKHVFLFRHCVRSTDSNVYLFQTNNDTSSQPITNFWSDQQSNNIEVPNWNVPKNWCTEVGMKQMQKTGAFLYDTLLSKHNNMNNHKLKFRFLSDTSQRDADTSLALQEGIANAMLNDKASKTKFTDSTDTSNIISLVSTNLHVTEYVPNLYQPFISTSMSLVPMCTLQISYQQWKQEVQDRLQTIPSPSISIIDILKLLKIDAVSNTTTGNTTSIVSSNNTNTISITTNIRNEPTISGMINFIKLIAQMIFYSRASGITPKLFLSYITNQQLYDILLPYIYYYRGIQSIGTTEAATRGAILTRTMMDAIQFDTSITDNTNEDTVTMLVGHDTDIDAVATAMNVAWQFNAPYVSNNNTNNSSSLYWYMTPPGSAIYIRHDRIPNSKLTTVTMSYMYPIYNIDANDGSIVSWEFVPLQLHNTTHFVNNDDDSKSIIMNHNSTTLRWNDLQKHINFTLQQYIGAVDCFNTAVAVSDFPSNDNTKSSTQDFAVNTTNNEFPSNNNCSFITPPTPKDSSSSSINTNAGTIDKSSSWANGFGCGIAVSMILIGFVWYYNYRKQRYVRRSQYNKPSSLQLDEYNDADTEMTNRRARRDINLI